MSVARRRSVIIKTIEKHRSHVVYLEYTTLPPPDFSKSEESCGNLDNYLFLAVFFAVGS